ncbi:hypothetical protein JHK86_016597 [Glycine max]|nr:hypothetical protein JHK86_016597 [Glycine max]
MAKLSSLQFQRFRGKSLRKKHNQLKKNHPKNHHKKQNEIQRKKKKEIFVGGDATLNEMKPEGQVALNQDNILLNDKDITNGKVGGHSCLSLSTIGTLPTLGRLKSSEGTNRLWNRIKQG